MRIELAVILIPLEHVRSTCSLCRPPGGFFVARRHPPPERHHHAETKSCRNQRRRHQLPSRSSTPRSATASRSRASRRRSTTSCASPSNSTTSVSSSSRVAGRAPTRRTSSSSRGPRPSLQLSTSTFVAFGSTRRPAARSTTTRRCRHLLDANTSAVCIVAKSSEYHVTEALKTTLDEGAAMIADSVEFLRGHGRQVLVDMEHFFDGYKENPEFSFRALEAAVVKGATARRAVRHQRRFAAARDRGDRRGTSRPRRQRRHDRYPLPRRHRMCGRQLDGRRPRWRPPRPGHVERARRAHRQRQPHVDHPEPAAQAGLRLPAGGPHGAADRGVATASPRRSIGRSIRRRRTSVRRRSPTRRACTSARSPVPRTPTSTSAPNWSATARGSWCPRWPARRRSR